MFTIKRRQSFEYAHRLMNHQGNCRFLHGHSGQAEVVIQSLALDDQSMVEDFSVLKAAMNTVLSQWDHATLLQRTDPLLETLQIHGQRVFVFDEQPTAEVMSRTLFNALQKFFPNRVRSVTILETQNNQATYEGVVL